MADFVLWPNFRELVVQLPQLQERMAWLADMSMYIKCDWPYPLEQALHRNPISGDVDLVDLAKVSTPIWRQWCADYSAATYLDFAVLVCWTIFQTICYQCGFVSFNQTG